MDRLRTPPLVGLIGCLLFVAVLAVPSLLLGLGSGSGAAAYYGNGALNPVVGGLFALICAIVLAAGRSGRTDPGLAAGVALVLGLFLVVLSGIWAVTVPRELVVGLSTSTLIEYHRWVLTAVAVVVPAATVAWTRALGLL